MSWQAQDVPSTMPAIRRPGTQRVMELSSAYHEGLWLRIKRAAADGRHSALRRLSRMARRRGRAQYAAAMRP